MKRTMRFILAAYAAACAYGGDPSVPTATVDQHAATFWFPVENADRTWSWIEGLPRQRAYAWLVEVSLMGQDYKFGYTKWNPPSGKEWPGSKGKGNLQGLILRGQVNLSQNGRTVKRICGVSAFQEGRSVVIQLTEPEFLMAFQRERPKQIVFETNGAALEKKRETVEVTYAPLPPVDAGATIDHEAVSERIFDIVQNNETIEREEAIALLEKAGGRYSEGKMRDGTKVLVTLPGKRFTGDEIPAIASRIPGVQFLAMGTTSRVSDTGLEFIKTMEDLEMLTVTGREISDAGVAQLCRLRKLQFLMLNNTSITDTGLEEISRIKNLKSLMIMRSGSVTPKGLAHLTRMKNLEQLSLIYVPVTDTGMEHLANMENLKMLRISHSPVTDASLDYLAKLEGLTGLFLVNTQVTPEAAKRLKEKHPQLTLPLTLTNPCEGNRQILANVKSRWAQKTGSKDGVQPTRSDLQPLFDRKFTADFNSIRCEKGGQISINPIGAPPSCSTHGAK